MNNPAATEKFNDGKDPEALRTIGEVSKAFGIKQHILRYWEQQFPMLDPLKRSGGRRYYRPQDVDLVSKIDNLINSKGYTLKGALRALREDRATRVEASPAQTAAPDLQTLQKLKAIRSRLADALAA